MSTEELPAIPVSTPSDLTDRAVIVTGAARGMGQATCVALAQLGADVAIWDVLDTDETEKLVEATGRSAIGQQVDIGSRAAVQAAAAEVFDRFGRIDGLVTCAAITGVTPDLAAGLDPLDEDEVRHVLGVNLEGTLWCIQAVLPHMRERGGGSIVCIGSLAAKTGGLFSTAHYVASKGGVHALTRWVARYGAQFRIRANLVIPGFIDTDMNRAFPRGPGVAPVGREGHVDDIAEAVCFLVSDASNFITGGSLDVNGGRRMD
jgi:3-oxoacyl-[acyl-carrier protein] reductase